MNQILSYYLRPFYWRITKGFIIKFMGTIMDLLIPWILAYMIDSVIPTKNKTNIYLWGLGMVLCSLIAVLLNIIANRMASKVASEATEVIRYDLFHNISYLSSPKTDEYTKPSLISRLTSDTYNVHNMIGRMQRLGVRSPILLIGGILVTLTLDPVLSFVLICILPFIAILMIYISKKSIPLYTILQKSTDDFIRDVRETINGMRVIKALSKGNYEKDKFDYYNSEVTKNEKKASTTMALINPCMNLLLNIGLILVIVVGALRVNSGLTQVGKILAFLTYFTIILNAMLSISRMFILFSKASASADRIMDVINCKDLDIGNIGDVISKNSTNVESSNYIEFKNVSFSYNVTKTTTKNILVTGSSSYNEPSSHNSTNVDELYAITNISFSLKKGETLGILGATGAGKSTIVGLLLRFYNPTYGTIHIDDTAIEQIPIEKLRNLFGVVFQNDTIFQDSILENIRLGRDLTTDQILQALTYAKADEFVTDINSELAIKGANLSGGQKQRILISRALAGKPSILILDDSSSALDYKTDALLRQQLKENFTNTTKIIIAQRISSIMNADHILVLDDGNMIDYGTHNELLSRCNVYQEISKSQMGGLKA